MIRACQKIPGNPNGEGIFDLRYTRAQCPEGNCHIRQTNSFAIFHPQSAIVVASGSPAFDLTGIKIIAAASNPKAPQMEKYAA